MTIIIYVLICDTFVSESARQYTNVLIKINFFFFVFSNKMSEFIIVICILKIIIFMLFSKHIIKIKKLKKLHC